jgi:hypothetical protein
MSTPREKVFRCTLKNRTRSLSGHFRAWDEREAAQLFREELSSTGVALRGTIQVKNLADRVERAFEFQR